MQHKIRQLPDESILILTLDGKFDVQEVCKAVSDRAAQISRSDPGPICRIIDARGMEPPLTAAALRVIEEICRTAADPSGISSQTYLVGSEHLLQIARYSGLRVGIFHTAKQAINQARLELSSKRHPVPGKTRESKPGAQARR